MGQSVEPRTVTADQLAGPFCSKCQRHAPYQDRPCAIIRRSDKKQPADWRLGDEGPSCSAYRLRERHASYTIPGVIRDNRQITLPW